jgi:hypothetical protein
MDAANRQLRASAMVMRVVGWVIILGLPLAVLGYPPGFMWGSHPADFPVMVPHPESPLDGLHPYLLMILSLYIGWAILLIRGARNPVAAASLFDWGILANGLHAVLMVFQAFAYPNEHAHLWADIPGQLAISAVLWYWHPTRRGGQVVAP